MPEMPEAAPSPDRPLLHVAEGYLAIAAPAEIAEACFSIPAVRAIRNAHPQGTLIIVAPLSQVPLWESLGDVDQIVAYHDGCSHRKIIALLESIEISFDSSIVWEDGPVAASFAKMDIKQRLGLAGKELDRHLTDPVSVSEKPGPTQHRVRQYLLFVEKLGISAFLPENFAHPPRPAEPEKPRVALVPGSDFGPSAEWPISRFAIMAKAIVENGTHDLLIFASPGRSGPALKLASEVAGSVTVVDDDLAQQMEMLATCEALIGCDGSIPHVAAYLGTECVVLFGPNEPQWKRPLGKIHRTLREQVPCSPCFLDKCPLDHRCMQGISVERVLEALAEDQPG